MIDQYGRTIEYVRLSVTDRCNLRCRYCMPSGEVQSLPEGALMSYAEMRRVAALLAGLGIHKVRLTGGEPLLRPGILGFVRTLKAIPGIRRVVMTTNGTCLPELADSLVQAGIDGVNISLDTLEPEAFFSLTGAHALDKVQAGLRQLLACGCQDIKLNCVPIQGLNEASLTALADLARRYPVRVRFIELMPIGCARTAGYQGIPLKIVRDTLERTYGPLMPMPRSVSDAGPACYFALAGFRGPIGFIDAIEHKFCARCNRIRLTADGFLKLCLNSSKGINVRRLLRDGIDNRELRQVVQQAVYEKPAEHFFGQPGEHPDTRNMYEVGG